MDPFDESTWTRNATIKDAAVMTAFLFAWIDLLMWWRA